MILNFVGICALVGVPVGLVVSTITYFVIDHNEIGMYSPNTQFRLKRTINSYGKEYYRIMWKRNLLWHTLKELSDDMYDMSYVDKTFDNIADAEKALNIIIGDISKRAKIAAIKEKQSYSNIITAKDVIFEN